MIIFIDCFGVSEEDIFNSYRSIIKAGLNIKKIEFVFFNVDEDFVFNDFEFSSYKCINDFAVFLDFLEFKKEFVLLIKAGAVFSKGFFSKKDFINYNKERIFVFKELGYNYSLNINIDGRNKINIDEDFHDTWIASNGFVCSSDVFKKHLNLKTRCPSFLKNLFLIVLQDIRCFYILKYGVDSGFFHEDKLRTESYLYSKDWYLEFNDFWSELFEREIERNGRVVDWMQYSYLYELSWRFWNNYNFKNKTKVWENEIPFFIHQVSMNLKHVSLEVIFNLNNLNNNYKIFFYKLKCNKVFLDYKVMNKSLSIVHDDKVLISTLDVPIDIELLDIEDDSLIIHCFYRFPLQGIDCKFYAVSNDSVFIAEKHGDFFNFKSMGLDIASDYDAIISIPLEKIGNSIEFYIESLGARAKLSLRFTRLMSKLYNEKSYWRYNNLLFGCRDKQIVVNSYSLTSHVFSEIKYLSSLLLEFKLNVVSLRLLYWLSKFYLSNKKIWIYFDKLYKAGDNAEYLYSFSKKQNDNIKHFYILRDDVPDAKRFNRDKISYIKFGTVYSKILFLNADMVFLTHSSIPSLILSPSIAYQLKDLYRYKVFCLQHGLTIQDLSLIMSKKVDNINSYGIASKFEFENLIKDEYKYKSKNLLPVGLARYDGLINNQKKQILLAPTWRNYLSAAPLHGNSRQYFKDFVSSDYFKLYSSILKNVRLKQILSEYNYSLIFLLHPCFGAQVLDFKNSENIKILAATDDVSYEALLTESSLLITDYSGIQFDFSYMYKPVLYYHPDSLPPSYSEGAYNYTEMALGEVFKEEVFLINAILEYVKNDCKVKENYRKKIDDFFYFHDKNNCQRIYKAAKKLCNE